MLLVPKKYSEYSKKNGYKIYTWKKRVDEDYWTKLEEINSPEEIGTKEVYFEK